jgi:sigma-E factor negative regulatory protein RseC
MIEELAQVTGLKGDKAIVKILRQGGCQGCEMNASCGTGSLGRLIGFKTRPLLITNNQRLIVGDRVIIGLADDAYILAASLVYLLPLVMMLLFAILADVLLQFGDAAVAIMGVVGLGAGIMTSGRVARRYFYQALSPQTIRRVS